MKINYDKKADALYIRLQEGSFRRSIIVTKDVYVDLDKQEKVLGVEILNASKNVPLEEILKNGDS